MSRWLRPVERALTAFLRSPLSVRKAMAAIVTATVVSVVAGGILITIVDPADFPDVGTGLWWGVQTVTTVGYGDVTPHDPMGRLVGTFIMLESIAFVSIVTAAITSNFVERARRQTDAAADTAAGEHTADIPSNADLAAQLAAMSAQLERLQLAVERDLVPASGDDTEPGAAGGR